MTKFVYSFNEGTGDMEKLLGVKGARLADMTKMGLPVPFGFILSSETCHRYYENDKSIGEGILEEIREKIADLENVTGKKFGSAENPLLLSVRSGAVVSLPGIMKSVLNIGINEETLPGLAKVYNKRFALDIYRRFIRMYGSTILGVPKMKFTEVLKKTIQENDVSSSDDLSEEQLSLLIDRFKGLITEETGWGVPQNPKNQLADAITSIYRDWYSHESLVYRRMNHIREDQGTPIIVQAMVFGNLGETSCTGVAFSRNPVDGEEKLFGDFLVNGQGSEVVSGGEFRRDICDLKKYFPNVADEFYRIIKLLEKQYRDVQDVEFTIENNRLYILQARSARRTAIAAVRTAVDMVDQKLISKDEAVLRIDADNIEQLMHPCFDIRSEAAAKVIIQGVPASPGTATGRICFSLESVQQVRARGESAILIKEETTPEDLPAMDMAKGLVTLRGGMSSHAAVTARGIGTCCVTGCKTVKIDLVERTLTVGDLTINEGTTISVNGTKGTVYKGWIKTVKTKLTGDFGKILRWADSARTVKVRANADTPKDVERALQLGADGVGLCRTERMFLEEDRLSILQRMIDCETEKQRRAVLRELLVIQREDFVEMFRVMEERPITIRLLDYVLQEENPLLGHRGCRQAISCPEIVETQVEAIVSAAIQVMKEKDIVIIPEILIPLVCIKSEIIAVKETIQETVLRTVKREDHQFDYQIGTMIEVPRAALTADELAEEVDFFSFGTNDLTELTYGFSSNTMIDQVDRYLRMGLFPENPFQSIDQGGVGKLIKLAVKLGNTTHANLKMGLCGDQGGDPESIEFCHKLGINYISCHSDRVPAARIAAGQAAIKEKAIK